MCSLRLVCEPSFLAMGVFSKNSLPEDEIQAAPDQDVEKTVPAHQETESAQPNVIPATTIDPELERRVLRKLDWRVPTLMAFFCTTCPPTT